MSGEINIKYVVSKEQFSTNCQLTLRGKITHASFCFSFTKPAA